MDNNISRDVKEEGWNVEKLRCEEKINEGQKSIATELRGSPNKNKR